MAEHRFDGLRAVVDRPVGGGAVVARFPGVVVVAAMNDADGAHGTGDVPVRRLLELCSAAAGEAPGRALARRLASWLGGAEAPPAELRFGTVSAAGDRWAVFLSGDVSLRDSHDAVVRGADVAAWVDQLIDAADGPLVLAIDGAAPGPDEPFRSLYDLRSGVVGGVAVTLTADEPALPRRAPTPPRSSRRRGTPGPARPGPPSGTGSPAPAAAPVRRGPGDTTRRCGPSGSTACPPTSGARRCRTAPRPPRPAGGTPRPRRRGRRPTPWHPATRCPRPGAPVLPRPPSTTRARTSACCAASG